MLPFSAEVLISTYGQYGRATWPAPVILYAGLVAGLLLALARPAAGGRLLGIGLAVAWAWIALAWFYGRMAALDFLAPVYGVSFLVEAALLGWAAVRGGLALHFRRGAAGWGGLALLAVALAVHPLLDAATGAAGARLLGTAPGPTAVFTLGVLLLADARRAWLLAVVPFLWTMVAAFHAWAIAIPQDVVIPLGGLAGLALVLASRPRGVAER